MDSKRFHNLAKRFHNIWAKTPIKAAFIYKCGVHPLLQPSGVSLALSPAKSRVRLHKWMSFAGRSMPFWQRSASIGTAREKFPGKCAVHSRITKTFILRGDGPKAGAPMVGRAGSARAAPVISSMQLKRWDARKASRLAAIGLVTRSERSHCAKMEGNRAKMGKNRARIPQNRHINPRISRRHSRNYVTQPGDARARSTSIMTRMT